MTINDFLARLNLSVKLLPTENGQVQQVAHLTQRTAEFNLTAIERSAGDILKLLQTEASECRVIEVCDRFGDYGVAGAVIFTVTGEVLAVDTFLLNCRVLGKNVEYVVLDKLGLIARQKRCSNIRLRYRASQRNALAGQFVKHIASKGELKTEEDGFSVMLPIAAIENLAVDKSDSSRVAASSPKFAPFSIRDFISARLRKLPSQDRVELITNTAINLRHSDQVRQFINKKNQRAKPDLYVEHVAPSTATEQRLAEIWQEVLKIEQVGIHDNFFHLGRAFAPGHSGVITRAGCVEG